MAYAKDPNEEKDIVSALEQMVGGLQDDGLGDDEEPTVVDDKKEE